MGTSVTSQWNKVNSVEALCLWTLARDCPVKTYCKHNAMLVGGSVIREVQCMFPWRRKFVYSSVSVRSEYADGDADVVISTLCTLETGSVGDIFALWISSTFSMLANTSYCIWIYNLCMCLYVCLFTYPRVDLPIVTQSNYQWWTGEPTMLFWWSIFGHALNHAIIISKTQDDFILFLVKRGPASTDTLKIYF